MFRIPNPHFPGAPARLSDGRTFTDYRPNCDINPPSWGDFETRQMMLRTGMDKIASDRKQSVLMAGQRDCEDTMVPESHKRICTWSGCSTVLANPVGLGTGRLYLPGRPDLATADPNTLAVATFPTLFGTYSQTSVLPANSSRTPAASYNRYSAPYG
jgi:hypothetical protein